ncbi:MAG: HD-GYP domain-containing protein [Candidatus Muiribacteriota bacterium]
MKVKAKKVENLKMGDIIAFPVLFNGAIIYSKNTEVNDEVKNKLNELKIKKVKIMDDKNTHSKVVNKESKEKMITDKTINDKIKNKFLDFSSESEPKEVIYTIRQLSQNNHPEFSTLIKLGFKKFNQPSILNELVIQCKKLEIDNEIKEILHKLLFSGEKKLVLSSIFIIEKLSDKNKSIIYMLKLLGQTREAQIINSITRFFKSFDSEMMKLTVERLNNLDFEDKSIKSGLNILKKLLNYKSSENKKVIPDIKIPVFSTLSKTDTKVFYSASDIEVKNVKEAVEMFKKNYVEANSHVEDIFNEITKNKVPDIKKVKNITSSFIDEIFYNRDLVARLRNIFTGENYLYSHALNVCILSVLTGVFLDYDSNKIGELGISALLADVGMIKLKDKFWNSTRKLKKKERESLKYHVFEGIELLKQNDDLKDIIATVSLQHHERLDGSGYLGQKKEDLTDYSKIVAIADVYDALTSPRAYRKAFTPEKALNYMIANTPEKFDSGFMHSFLKHVGFFPLGTKVKLSNGKMASIAGTNNGFWVKPKIFLGNNEDDEVNLKLEKNLYIKEIIKEEGEQNENWYNI